jgi:hypothetical protein
VHHFSLSSRLEWENKDPEFKSQISNIKSQNLNPDESDALINFTIGLVNRMS